MPAGRRAPRKPSSVAIEHADGEPLTRADIQFELLSHIFADETKVFSDPSGTDKLSFRDLYVNAILRSTKAKSVLKEKLLALSTFATDFAMLALLTNVGRIAATMSFFAEMRTAQRTIKAILKTCILEGDSTKNGLATPAQVLARIEIGKDHLPDIEFLDLFLPNPASSASRARGPAGPEEASNADVVRTNPFCDPGSPGKAPGLVILTPDEVAAENLDPEDEKERGSRLIAQREAIVQDHLLKDSAKESKAKADSIAGETPSPAKPKRQRAKANAKAGPSSTPLNRKAPEPAKEEDPEPEEMSLKPLQLDDEDDFDRAPQLQTVYRRELHSPIPPPRPFPPPVAPPDPYSHRYSPYKRSRQRTMLQHAWNVVATSDPLADTDEDDDDEHVRQDHADRLAVISRVRGKAPTPEPEGVRPIPLRFSHWQDDDDLFVTV
ncbi:hypothetical protein K438DRAFT_1803820 [Mycena galopus ATCC 62051]|nr:hypothetical protein K438DRAFT_1803820 [Mycena galopus ATCC 62051]